MRGTSVFRLPADAYCLISMPSTSVGLIPLVQELDHSAKLARDHIGRRRRGGPARAEVLLDLVPERSGVEPSPRLFHEDLLGLLIPVRAAARSRSGARSAGQ